MRCEFEKLTKVTVTTDEYQVIEGLYMASPETKEVFCKQLKAKDFVLNLRLNKVLELEAKLARIQNYAERAKVNGQSSYENELNKASAQKIQNYFGETSVDLYGYNRKLMGLERSVSMGDILEML